MTVEKTIETERGIGGDEYGDNDDDSPELSLRLHI